MHPINIYLCRHARSTENGLPLFGQSLGSTLSDVGKEQAKKLGQRFLKEKIIFDKVYSSSYLRALETTTIVKDTVGYNGITYNCAELVEYSPGEWRGQNREEKFADPKTLTKFLSLNMGFLFPKGESLHQVERRAATWLEDRIIYNEEVLKLADEKPLNMLVMSHGITCRTIIHYVMGFSPAFIWNFEIDNTALTHLIYSDRGWYIKRFADTSHLTNDK